MTTNHPVDEGLAETARGEAAADTGRGLSFAERVRQVVDRAPPLTADQLSQIRDLLPPPDRRQRADGADAA